jgi:hypothetical protein
MVLALLVPGAGHLYLGRRARAAVFFCVIISLFLAGIALDGRLYTTEPGGLLSLLATIGEMGIGIPYLIARKMGIPGDITSITYEYGTAFMLTAGLMNLLLVVDAFDIAEGRKDVLEGGKA